MLHWKSIWYWYALGVSILVVVIALGPGLTVPNADLVTWMGSWQKQLFSTLCHQQPERLLFFNDAPMAVCSRCFGIYASFLFGMTLLPILPQHKLRSKFIIPLLVAGVLLNIVDVLTYATGYWSNTHVSRLIAGALLGIPAAVLLGTSNPQYKVKVK